MATLTLEGDTLGEKHRNYNKFLNEVIKDNSSQYVTPINYEDPDLDNLYKIDIACNNRNVDYVLEVLKCEDMLYVSRAIKKSTWLITDEQYGSIINPEYLHLNLYPEITSKAYNKLILHVRLHLKDEKRVEGFFNYFKDRDLQNAIKWLPGCSIPFIENIFQKHADDIPIQILKRLYKKSITFLTLFIRYRKSYFVKEKIIPAKFHIKRNSEKFLDIIETTDLNDIPNFGPKYTKRIMEKIPERIKRNLESFVNILDIAAFAKFVPKEDAKNFILTNIRNKKMRSWFHHTKIKHFLKRIPVEEQFDFVRQYFIDKSVENVSLKNETWDDIIQYCCPPSKEKVLSSKNIYNWYIYAPFNTALKHLKQMIGNESNPSERKSILLVLLICAGSDMKNIFALLKYYREHHINEAFKFKIQFVNQLLSKTDTHKFDKEAWGYLNDLFNSMEVYTKSDKDVQSCVRTIILRNLINGESIPDIIEQKFEFENLDNKKKFNKDERDKIFNFLYEYLISKIKEECNTEKKFSKTHDIVVKVLNLLKNWNKNVSDYPYILQKIKDLVIVRKENGWDRDLSDIYNIKKSWRKLLFTESIPLSPTEESCINALKHDLQLLEIHKDEINKLCINDNVVLERFLKKIRIYFHQSLSRSFKQLFLENLNQINSHDALTKGLCILLSRKEITNLVHKYAPTESKIDWSQPDNIELSLRKHIAKNMHLARPQPTLVVALKYAKGENLQFAMSSLNALLYNQRASVISKHLTKLPNSPVSLQKLGVQVAFSKLKHEELRKLFLEIWNSTKNSIIRSDIFYQSYKMLCKQNGDTAILELWGLLSLFIDSLTFDENKKIYVTLSKADKVPLSVRPAFWIKSYNFLNKLPPKANCKSLIDALKSQMDDINEFLDIDFMSKLFLYNFVTKFSTQQYEHSYILAVYLLSTKNETAKMERFVKVLLPLIDQALAIWNVLHENVYYTRYNLHEIFSDMSIAFQDVVIRREMILPIAMYTAALNKLQNSGLSIKENYVLLTHIKLSLGYIQILNDLKMNNDLDNSHSNENISNEGVKWENLHIAAAPTFGELCLGYLKEDVVKHFPSIYTIFADILENIFYQYVDSILNRLRVLEVFVDNKDFIQGQLLVLQIMPNYYLETEDEKSLRLELINEISSHASEEVAMQYWKFHMDNNG